MNKEKIDKVLHTKLEAGALVSPVLAEGVKNYLIY